MCLYELYMQTYAQQSPSWKGCGLSEFGAASLSSGPLSSESTHCCPGTVPAESAPFVLLKALLNTRLTINAGCEIKSRDFTTYN